MLTLHEPHQVADQTRTQDVIAALVAVLVVVDDLRLPQYGKMLRDVGLPDFQQVLDVRDALGRFGQIFEQRQANRMPQKSQQVR